MRVAEDLHLDVLGAGDVALEEDLGAAERGAGFALRFRAACLRVRRRCATTRMPRPPPPKLALIMSGKPIAWPRRSTSAGSAGRARCPGMVGTFACLREPLGRRLVAERFELIGRRPDERDARLCAGPREGRVLGQEAVAGMDRVDAVLLRDGDDRLDVQVRP